MPTKIDSRQMINKAELAQLATGVDIEVDDLLGSIDSEVTPMLRLYESGPVDRILNIGPSFEVNPETGKNRTIQPVDELLPIFTGGTLTLPAASGSNIVNSDGDDLLLTIGNDKFIKCLVSLKPDGTIEILLGAEGASENLATLPAPLSATLPIGYLVISTVGAAVQNVTYSEIYQFSSGGGGGGGSNTISVEEATHGFALLDAIYFDGSNWLKAQSNDAATLASHIVSKVTDVDNFVGVKFGEATKVAHGLTVGQHYFLSSTTPGGAVLTEPALGNFSCPIFQVLDADTVIAEVHRPSSVGTGTSASGLNWSAGFVYDADDMTWYLGVLYKSLVGSNLNNIPLSSPSEWGPGIDTTSIVDEAVSTAKIEDEAVIQVKKEIRTQQTGATSLGDFRRSATATNGGVSYSGAASVTNAVVSIKTNGGVIALMLTAGAANGFIKVTSVAGGQANAAFEIIADGETRSYGGSINFYAGGAGEYVLHPTGIVAFSNLPAGDYVFRLKNSAPTNATVNYDDLYLTAYEL